MDGTTSPGRANGCRLVKVNPLPASFVAFFPAAREANTESFEISWTDKFVAQKPATLPRAWCRVPVAAGLSTLRRGRTIMKRVGRSTNSPAVRPQKVAAVEVVAEDLEETQQASRRRLNSFVPPAQEAQLELVGSPLSRAEVVNTMIRAKVNVANCFLREEYTEISDQRSLAKQSTFSKMTVPMKRRFHDHSSIGLEYASGGNRMAIYSELDPIISKALQTGVTEIDVNMASITEAAAHLQSTRRNPRVSLAASGTPELSDIVDVVEPSSPLTLEPNESMTDAKSPTKRDSTQSPSPTKSNKSFRKRLSDTIVKLLPVSNSRAEPSPIKPASPPTPDRDVRERRPSITLKSPNAAQPSLSANPTPGLVRWSSTTFKDSPFARWRPKRKSEPAARLLSESSSLPRNEASSITDTIMGQSFRAPESPAQPPRPSEPTPSKWNGSQPSTPGRKPSSTAATPVGDELELVKSLPEWMQQTQSPATLEKCDLSNIDFGPASPSFTNSVSWVNSPEDAIESERTKIVRRRKSEPLFRSLLKTQTSRRISLSPQKPIVPDGMSEAMPAIDEDISHIEEISQISVQLNASEESNILATLANVPNDTTEQEDENMDILSAQYKQKMQAIMEATGSKVNPDDVFSPDSEKSAVERLAKMAESKCNGHANVVIAKEGGRLFVRFKLPFEYASMFPESQGADESRFSSSPSVSSSPRVQPAAVEPEPPLTEEEMWELEEQLYLEECDRRDQTLIVSDFGSSPIKRGTSSPLYDRLPTSSPAPQSQDVNDVSISFPDITYAPEGNTTIPTIVNSSPIKTPRATKSMINSDSSSISDLEHTPSLNKSAELSITNMATVDDEEQQEAASTTPAALDTTPVLSLSFTPVNQASARKSSSSSSNRSTKSTSKATPENEAGKPTPIPATSHTDTPERDYMRDFIRRSRPRRPSTTELGSPIAPIQRRPLGARSPNMETQQREKRKFDSSEGEENESETKSETKTEPAAKRIRRLPRSTPPRPASAVANDHSDDEDPLAMDVNAATSADELANAEDQENAPPATAAVDAATSRRSSRLRTMPATVPKSSIPAPVKVGRGRPANSTLGLLRTEQHDLVHQTRANTRRNKGKAEYPAQVIAKRSEESAEEVDQEMSDEPEEAEVSKTRNGKGVVWKEPLADYHEEAKPKRGRPPGAAPKANAAKAKAKPVSTSRITKPAPKVSTAAQKQRTSRLAAGLGMAGNGTPAPKRVTRASARSRK